MEISPSRVKALAAELTAQGLLSTLDEGLRADLVERLQVVHLDADDILFRQGDARDALFLLVAGRMALSVAGPGGKPVQVGEVLPGQLVGEIGLLVSGTRSNTARAVQASDLLCLSRAEFEGLCQARPEAIRQLPESIAPAMWQNILSQALTDLLGELDATEIYALEAEIERVDLRRGDVVVHQGDPADCMYLVVYGRLSATVRDDDGVERDVDELGRGDLIGERSLITGDCRSATVFAVRDSALARISPAVLHNLQQRHPDVMTRIARAAILRVQRRAAHPGARHAADATSVAVVAAGQAEPGAALAELVGRLAEALGRFGRTLLLSSDRLDEMLGTPGIAQVGAGQPADALLSGWLSRQEQSYATILYVADATATPWTERCLSRADRVVLVVEGARAPQAGPLDELVAQRSDPAESELVLVQPDEIHQPRGTGAWLARYPVEAHHHVRLGHPADVHRLARRLSGRSLGLVLGGGGARGFSHTGVFRALDEAGVRADLVGGTSMGAVLSAAYAVGLDYAAQMALARRLASPLKLFDPTVPAVSFFASGKVTGVLQELFGDTQLEDLWTPCFCVSTNLTHAVPMVHRRGPLWQAVRASLAIPGIFSPILYEGDLLVDGCVLNNVPIDVMQRLNLNGPIVAVNVFPDLDMIRNYRFGPSVSGVETLLHGLVPLRRKESAAPFIFESLLRVLALNDVHQAKTKRSLADLYIRPPVEQFNILDFGAYARIAQIGYESGRAALADWRRLAEVQAAQAGDAAPVAACGRGVGRARRAG